MYKLYDKNKPIIQKYGGTSVGDVARIKNIASRVRKQFDQGYRKIAVVVSAQSGETNRLVGLVKEANEEASDRAYSLAVSAGEQVSVGLMAAALESEGLAAEPFLAYQMKIVTSDHYASARIRSIDTSKLFDAWERGTIPVIAGFQGINDNFEITTLGRGGTDTSAVAIAVAVEASFCEINTDVDGVFTTDPRVCSKARLIKELDYETALEMAALGSKVLHPRCVELAAKYKMPVVVRNTFKPDDFDRTYVMDGKEIESLVVSGITVERNISSVFLQNIPNDESTLSTLFEKLSDSQVNIDIIIHNRPLDSKVMNCGFSVTSDSLDKVKSTMQSLTQLPQYSQMLTEYKDSMAKITLVGVGMQSYSGVASRVFMTLAKNQISVKMVSTSEIKISCVVDSSDVEKAVNCLHQEFLED